jgi:hypothetical protein
LIAGQTVPSARASQFLKEVLGSQLSAGSMTTFVKTCPQQ